MEDSEPKLQNRHALIGVAVLVAIVILAAGVTVFMKRSKPDATASTSQAANYKDGSYTATGSYNTPGGRESIDVALVLKNNMVTDVNVHGSGNTDHAKEHQADFESGYKQYVVGKPLKSVKLSRVSGSSLTSNGFNSAIDSIAQQAIKN